MHKISANVKKLKLGGYNITKVANEFQKAYTKRGDLLMTQKGVESYLSGVNEGLHFSLSYQHYLNQILDVLFIPSGLNFDYTYEVHIDKLEDSFRYESDALDAVKTKVCYLSSSIIDENCVESHLVTKDDEGEKIKISVDSTAEMWVDNKLITYVKSIKIETTTDLPFKHDTLITFDNYFFSTKEDNPTKDDTFVLPLTGYPKLYSDPECTPESLVTPTAPKDKCDYPQGWYFPEKVYYMPIYKNTSTKEIIITFESWKLLLENFDTWLAKKKVSTTTIEQIILNITDDTKVENLYLSPRIKDICFVITKPINIYYPAPRLINTTIYGSTVNDQADTILYIDESYVDAELEKTTHIRKVNTINVKEIHLTSKYFDNKITTDAMPGDFGSWEDVKCDKLVFENIGYPLTIDNLKSILMIKDGNIGSIEFVDSI